jgi:DNA-binding transcriptional LysR family regulator
MRLLSPELLRTFVTVAEARSFTTAAQRLALGQSTVSQHVKRLEELLQRRLLARDTHSVVPTPDGDALLAFARQILEAEDRLDRFFSASGMRGRLRIGMSEDFVPAGLQGVLTEFTRRHSSVDLELTIGLSGMLYDRFDGGDLDVIFAKRRQGDTRGTVARQERLVWIGPDGFQPNPQAPLPLLLYPPPSITRALALEALEAVGRSWRVACTSGSLSGIYAAAQAGLGVAPHSERLVPPGLAVLPPMPDLPQLGTVDFVLIGPGRHHAVAMALIDVVLEVAGRLAQPLTG